MKKLLSIMMSLQFVCSCQAEPSNQVTSQTRELRVAVQSGPSPAGKFRETLVRFSNETGIKVIAVVRNDHDYKEDIQRWLVDGVDTPDVVHWQSSNRLYQFAERGALLPLTELWRTEGYDKDFSQVKNSMQYKGDVWAVPLSYYHWGLYYKKSTLLRYGTPPKTWSEMLRIGKLMQRDGLIPFGLGNRELWPAAAWFDYLNLRINGLKFHRDLLNGKVAFTDIRVVKVMTELKKAIDGNFFDPTLLSRDTNEIAPMLMRGRIGFTLMSNGITALIPYEQLDDIGFIPFPEITSGNNFEDSPIDVLMVPKNGEHREEAMEFLKFMMRPDIQTFHNAGMGFLPPNRRSHVASGAFTNEGAQLLKSAKGLAQYFDRDTIPAFEKAAMPLLGEFMRDGDVDRFLTLIESARQTIFLKREEDNLKSSRSSRPTTYGAR